MLSRVVYTFSAAACAALALAAWATSTRAGPIADPAGDFLPSYVGPKDPDLDVTSVSGVHDPSHGSFHLSATVAGPIDPASTGFYVFGVNRGAGVATFAGIGATGVLFDAVVIVTEAGAARAVVSGVTTPLTSFALSGNTVSVDVPKALLPSTGFALAAYEVNMWPRIGAPFTGTAAISDFAPDNASIRVDVPEPTSLGLLAAAMAAATAIRRRRLPAA